MSTPLQPINYMQQRDLTPSEWWELYKKTKMDGEASVRECELEIKDLKIRAQKADRERDELREQLYIAVGMLSTHPKFENKHPEEVWEFVKEAAK